VARVDFPLDPKQQLLGASGPCSARGTRSGHHYEAAPSPRQLGHAVNVQAMVFGIAARPPHRRRVHRIRHGRKKHYGDTCPMPREKTCGGDPHAPPLEPRGSGTLPSWRRPAGDPFAAGASLLPVGSSLRDMLTSSSRWRRKALHPSSRRASALDFASVRCAVEMVGRLSILTTAVERVEPEQLISSSHPSSSRRETAALEEGRLLARGSTPPRGSSGKVALSAERVWRWPGKGEGPPGPGGNVSRGYRGMRRRKDPHAGGHDLHAAVVARGMGKICVSAAPISWWTRSGASSGPGHGDRRGGALVHRRTTGEVIRGSSPRFPRRSSRSWWTVPFRDRSRFTAGSPPSWSGPTGSGAWACGPTRHSHRLRVARAFGAGGIGLCRTETCSSQRPHCGGAGNVLSETEGERRRALAKLLPMQRGDFPRDPAGHGRLARHDPAPGSALHEFLPKDRSALGEIAAEWK